MPDQKTKPTAEDVETFLNGIAEEKKRRSCFLLLQIMREITDTEPELWAGGMVGFGRYHYRYPSGHQGDTFLVGFAPRKDNLALYVLSGFQTQEELLKKLGKHKAGKGCLYIKSTDDVDVPTLRSLIEQSAEHKRQTQST
ncbi:MAG: DUF1801 domain-containing protein [Anaerolineae bacterium]